MNKQNLAGTTNNTFQIGKNGVTIHWGTTIPSFSAPNGDIYIKTTATQAIYNRINNAWVVIGTNYSVNVSVDFGNYSHFVKIPVSVDWAENVSDIKVSDVFVGNVNKSAEDLLLEEISFKISNITSSGFDLLAYAPNGTFGVFDIVIRGS